MLTIDDLEKVNNRIISINTRLDNIQSQRNLKSSNLQEQSQRIMSALKRKKIKLREKEM